MRFRPILFAALFLWHLPYAAASQPKKKDVKTDSLRVERFLPDPSTEPTDSFLSGMVSVKPEMPLGPPDILKAYEIGMNLVVQQMSEEFRGILQAQQTNQITREQAEYLLQQRYQLAMMQFQVLSALHDVLKHDIDQAAEQPKQPNKTRSDTDTILTVPLPAASAVCK